VQEKKIFRSMYRIGARPRRRARSATLQLARPFSVSGPGGAT